jgi:2'-5' RNA ligase
VRLFVALDLPAPVRAEVSAWAASAVGRDERLRLVGDESLHATLVFLGECPDPAPAAKALASALDPVPEAPALSIAGPLWLAPRRPHVLTVAIADPSGGLAAIHGAVLDALVREAGHAAERRPFRPHVTVARIRGRLRPFELLMPPELTFRPPAVTLYRSVLGRGPASYEALASVRLSTLS